MLPLPQAGNLLKQKNVLQLELPAQAYGSLKQQVKMGFCQSGCKV